VEDFSFVSYRPYIYQLAALLDTYERLGVIHVDQVGARLYLFHLGNLVGIQGFLGEEVRYHKAGGWAASRYQRHEAETARQNLQDAAELAEEYYRRRETRHLILAGTEKNLARFKDLLSNRLRSIVIGVVPADSNASPAELQEKVAHLAQETAHVENTALADTIITAAHKGQNAVLGLSETLNAVQTGRAQNVVILAGYSQPAYRYVDSRYVVLEKDEEALANGRIEELPDAVDSVLRRALMQGIGVSLLQSHKRLEEAGKIGALTRY
jgi:peptide chain release factor subunit 1